MKALIALLALSLLAGCQDKEQQHQQKINDCIACEAQTFDGPVKP